MTEKNSYPINHETSVGSSTFIKNWDEIEQIIIDCDTCISPQSPLRLNTQLADKYERAKEDFEQGRVVYYKIPIENESKKPGYIRLITSGDSVFLDYIIPADSTAFDFLKKLAMDLRGQYNHFYLNAKNHLVQLYFSNFKRVHKKVSLDTFPNATTLMPRNNHDYLLVDIME